MASWVRVVSAADIVDGADYFVGMPPKTGNGVWYFWSQYKGGKRGWSQKPGIAVRYAGGDGLKQLLADNQHAVAVAVPGDADRRWRARSKGSFAK